MAPRPAPKSALQLRVFLEGGPAVEEVVGVSFELMNEAAEEDVLALWLGVGVVEGVRAGVMPDVTDAWVGAVGTRPALPGEEAVEASAHNWGPVVGHVVERAVGPVVGPAVEHIEVSEASETSEGILVEQVALDFESEAESAVVAKVSRKGAAVLALVVSVRPL